ncbi:hypothetical protein TRVL_06409 [Trypanosoma vivax]|nr:hypothetical protein TRVL_06409 [Trypanosoma vivax]
MPLSTSKHRKRGLGLEIRGESFSFRRSSVAWCTSVVPLPRAETINNGIHRPPYGASASMGCNQATIGTPELQHLLSRAHKKREEEKEKYLLSANGVHTVKNATSGQRNDKRPSTAESIRVLGRSIKDVDNCMPLSHNASLWCGRESVGGPLRKNKSLSLTRPIAEHGNEWDVTTLRTLFDTQLQLCEAQEEAMRGTLTTEAVEERLYIEQLLRTSASWSTGLVRGSQGTTVTNDGVVDSSKSLVRSMGDGRTASMFDPQLAKPVVLLAHDSHLLRALHAAEAHIAVLEHAICQHSASSSTPCSTQQDVVQRYPRVAPHSSTDKMNKPSAGDSHPRRNSEETVFSIGGMALPRYEPLHPNIQIINDTS